MRPIRPTQPQKVNGRPFKGAQSPGIGYLYVLFTMIIAIAAGTVLSGGFVPVDPNSPGGPPTVEPYYDPNDYGKQEIIITPGKPNPAGDRNLQLKTFMVNTCGQRTAIDFLIDTSGSMQFDGKMDKTKDALRAFTDKLVGKSAIGMQTFSKDAKEVVPLSYYKDVKTEFAEAVDDLKPDGHTVTRDGFNLAKQKLIEAIQSDRFPDYNYALIVITDGVPELPPSEPRTCVFQTPEPNLEVGYRCFTKEQDPTELPSVADDIKTMGVDIYAINLYSSSFPSDKAMLPYLQNLLQRASSTPTDTHYFTSINGDDLNRIFDTVTQTICDPAKLL